MLVQPYLFFDGRCEEALEFYTSALGAEVTMGMHRKSCSVPDPIEAVRILVRTPCGRYARATKRTNDRP